MNSTATKITWETFVDYATKDKDYKDKAHQMVVEELGFAPDLAVGAITEIFMRSSLKRFDEGALTAEKLTHHLKTRCQVVRNLIPKHAPHQIVLLKKHPAKEIHC